MALVSHLKKENEKGIPLEVHTSAHSSLLIPLMHFSISCEVFVINIANKTPTAPETKFDMLKPF